MEGQSAQPSPPAPSVGPKHNSNDGRPAATAAARNDDVGLVVARAKKAAASLWMMIHAEVSALVSMIFLFFGTYLSSLPTFATVRLILRTNDFTAYFDSRHHEFLVLTRPLPTSSTYPPLIRTAPKQLNNALITLPAEKQRSSWLTYVAVPPAQDLAVPTASEGATMPRSCWPATADAARYGPVRRWGNSSTDRASFGRSTTAWCARSSHVMLPPCWTRLSPSLLITSLLGKTTASTSMDAPKLCHEEAASPVRLNWPTLFTKRVGSDRVAVPKRTPPIYHQHQQSTTTPSSLRRPHGNGVPRAVFS